MLDLKKSVQFEMNWNNQLIILFARILSEVI